MATTKSKKNLVSIKYRPVDKNKLTTIKDRYPKKESLEPIKDRYPKVDKNKLSPIKNKTDVDIAQRKKDAAEVAKGVNKAMQKKALSNTAARKEQTARRKKTY